MNVRRIEFDDTWERVETGAIAFGNDWPGLFIRGDQCIDMMNRLHHAKLLLDRYVPEGKKQDSSWFFAKTVIDGLIKMVNEDVLIKPFDPSSTSTPSGGPGQTPPQ
jgi:hypothetical protein